ncbi:MAG TPA: helix-turn-helix transcriptional regulator [Cyclobacteriaceae bacterium]|nr:helix-turn-helix transcriptional regulator [Cyclobacteriaceae bacterium]
MAPKLNVLFLEEASAFLDQIDEKIREKIIYNMKEAKKMKIYSLDEITDKYIGKLGTKKRDAFEYELRLDLLGEAIKQARQERHLTQEELGKLVGVQRAQISKIENSLTDARFETILKVFKALNAKVNFTIELLNQKVNIA